MTGLTIDELGNLVCLDRKNGPAILLTNGEEVYDINALRVAITVEGEVKIANTQFISTPKGKAEAYFLSEAAANGGPNIILRREFLDARKRRVVKLIKQMVKQRLAQ